ncbi:HAD family hydrolase [Hydrogenibacillus sp. N12]|uniref:HAD family hydrolase n=1 Tax=Hydrogenibacillus sp. N12 TaxID=2866627 RepID=UPI001C7DE0A2|nr:HAD family hydrolase [Hydrogenibacillus sp. N12]QZA33095.1 HAD hydrolase-like protein [Hydrogenibacillus sp. N12]
MRRPAVVFDLDGTLFDAWSVAREAFAAAFRRLRSEAGIGVDLPSEAVLRAQLGKTYAEMWAALLPGRELALYALADAWMFEAELALIRQGKGRLYPGVPEVLQALTERGLPLFIASNGREEYVAAVIDHFDLRRHFVDLYSAGRFRTATKSALVAKLRTTYGLASGLMVGDRKSDVDAGRENGFLTVGCLYGYGDAAELREADVTIEAPPELLALPVLAGQG